MELPQKTGFFQESPNTDSNMRLNSFILLMFFISYHLPFGFANAIAAYKGNPITALSESQLWFDVIVLAFVFIPKGVQKIVELKFSK